MNQDHIIAVVLRVSQGLAVIVNVERALLLLALISLSDYRKIICRYGCMV